MRSTWARTDGSSDCSNGHCEEKSDEAIQSSFVIPGLLRYARNDENQCARSEPRRGEDDDQVLLQRCAEPDQGRAVPGRGLASVRADPGGHAQERPAQEGL